MTSIRLYRDRRGRLCGYSVIGHVDSVPEGADVICASVSTLALTGFNALETVAGIRATHHLGDGFLSVRLPKGLNDAQRQRARIVLRTVRRGFCDIATAYPQYVRISQT